MNPFKFVSHDAPNQTDKLFTKVQKGEKLTREEKDTIFHTKLKGGDYGYKIMGWFFPFGHYLNTYLIEYKHGDIVKVYAPDKTSIRNSYYTNSNIYKIHQIND